MQEEPSSLQEPASIMQIHIYDKADANFPVKFSGFNVITLNDMGTNMSCISYACYVKLKNLPSLVIVSAMSVNSATGHELCPVGLMCCDVTTGKSQFKHTLILCKKIQKELIIFLDMQELHHLGVTGLIMD